MNRIVPWIVTAGLVVPDPVLAASPAEAIAARTGEVIGGAAACGLPDGELVALGRKVIEWARDTARDAAELRAAQRAHEAAVNRGAARVERAGRGACAAAVRSFRELEQDRR